MSGYGTSWRIAGRLARRRLARRPWYTTLMAAILALPAFIGGFLISVDDAIYDTPGEYDAKRLGTADLALTDLTEDEAAAIAPEGSTLTLLYVDGVTYLEDANATRSISYASVELADPLVTGMFITREGRGPEHGDEVAISRGLAERLGVGVGDRVRAGTPPRPFSVTGIVDDAMAIGDDLLVSAADNPLSSDARTRVLVGLPPGVSWSPPVDDERFGVVPPARFDRSAAMTHATGVIMVAGFGMAQVLLLVGAVFAVGARRARRDMARLSALGMPTTGVRRILTAEGLLLGAAGGVVGAIASVIAFHAGHGLIEHAADHALDPSRPSYVGIAAASIGTVLLSGAAAHLPSRRMVRGPITAALTDRERAARRAGHRVFWAGVPALVLGATLIAYGVDPEVANLPVAVFGAGLAMIGIAAAGPLAVGVIAAGTRRLPVAPRLAARHAARRRLRTGAALAAICAATAGTMGLSIYLTAVPTTPPPNAQAKAPAGAVWISGDAGWLSDEDRGRVAEALGATATASVTPASDTAMLRTPGCVMPDGTPCDLPQTVAIGGTEIIELLTGRLAPPGADSILRDGGAVVFYREFDDSGTGRVQIVDEQVALPVLAVPLPEPYRDMPGAVVGPDTAAALGIEAGRPRTVFLARENRPESVEAATTVLLQAQLAAGRDAPETPVRLAVADRPSTSHTVDAMAYVLAVAAATVTLVAAAVAVGLAQQELRGDYATLGAIGASRRVRRRVGAVYALLVVGLGTVLGVVSGFGPAAGLSVARPDLTWDPPWTLIGVFVVILPLLAAAGTHVLTPRRLPMTRRLD